jgi:hypothetical protein
VKSRHQHYRVWFSDGPDRQSKELVAGEDFRLDFEAPGRFFCGDLPPHLLDLMRVAMATYAVDRLVRRRANESRSWRRDLSVRVEVLDPDFWGSPEVLNRLREAVEFVTGDFWDFEFTKGCSSYEGTSPLLTRAFASESPLICLYSGGLDSAAGLTHRLRDCADRPVLPVTVKHQPRQHVLIGDQFDRLRGRFGARIEPLVIKAAMIRPADSRWRKEESSQRGRSFLFTAAGAVAAVLSGSGSVEVYESGIGAINVPLMAGMLGTKATRGCHPEFMRRMSRLVSTVAGRDVAFRLPFLDLTKGEMVRDLKGTGLADLARETVSCVRYPTGHHSYQQCGYCPACLFRRQAMLVAGIRERRGTYSFDLFGPAKYVNRIRHERLNSLRAFLMQAASLATVQTTGRLPEPVERHLRDTQILGPGDSPDPIINLLTRNSDEWRVIAGDGRRKGYDWARLLDPPRTLVGEGASHAIT